MAEHTLCTGQPSVSRPSLNHRTLAVENDPALAIQELVAESNDFIEPKEEEDP